MITIVKTKQTVDKKKRTLCTPTQEIESTPSLLLLLLILLLIENGNTTLAPYRYNSASPERFIHRLCLP